MTGTDDKSRGGIELVGSGSDVGGIVVDAPASSGLVIDDGSDDADGSSGLVVDDDQSPRTKQAPTFGDPMPLSYADAQRLSDGKLETSKVLGLIDRETLPRLNDGEVQAQVARFLKKLQSLEMQFGDLQKARGKLVNYRTWLQEITTLKNAPDAAQKLRAIISREDRRSALEELEMHIRVVLDDKLLEWAEHNKILRKAEQLGLTVADVEATYKRFEPFEREPRAAAERAAATGWSTHPKLTTSGEVFAWNLKRLRDVFLERFDVAVEIANQPFDKTYSLYDYLDRNRDDAHKDHALRAREVAEEAACPPLAVWYFLWTTGPAVLHLAGKKHRPVRARKRQIESIEELKELVATEWVLDDLGSALEGGLLENWLFIVTKNEKLLKTTAELRQEARGIADSKRAEFLRQSSIRVLWQAGFKGLPLCDDAKRSVVVEDLAQLTSRAEQCWDSLEWSLRSGVLADWLDGVSKADAAHARAAARSVGKQALDLATWSFLWISGSRRLLLAASRPVSPESQLGVVESLDSLREIIDAGTRAACIDNLLRGGFFEAWLREALREDRLATVTAKIVGDDRKLKVERFAQLIGCRNYQVGGVTVSSVEDFAQLPLKVADPIAIWHHIHEGVPQERFRDSPETIRVLEDVRGARNLSDAAKAMVACIRLGLRILPHAGGRLQHPGDLADLLDVRGGRDLLHDLLTSGVLEVWAETIRPGTGARVASAKSAPAHLAADRVARLLGARTLHPVPGRRALTPSSVGFDDLVDPLARDRVRDALFGPVPLPDVAGAFVTCTEEELEAWPKAERARVFGWKVLRLPTISIQNRHVNSIEQLLDAITDPTARAEVSALAATGALGVWLEGAHRRQLSPGLRGKVHPALFPALCLELGESPPIIEFHWSRRSAIVEEGQAAHFELVVVNRDPLRAAHFEIDHRCPAGLAISCPADFALAPGGEARIPVALQPAKGKAGETCSVISLRHAHPNLRLPVVETARLGLRIGFPWQPLVLAGMAWMVVGALAMLVAREALQASAGQPDARDGLGVAAIAILVAIERFAVWKTTGRFWLHPVDVSMGDTFKVGAGIFFLVFGIKECSQASEGNGFVALILAAMVATGLYFLARRDLLAAAMVVILLLARGGLGRVMLKVAIGLDRSFGALIGVFDSSGSEAASVIAWTVAGGLMGLASGLAIGFRAISRPYTGELARVGVLLLGLALGLIGHSS